MIEEINHFLNDWLRKWLAPNGVKSSKSSRKKKYEDQGIAKNSYLGVKDRVLGYKRLWTNLRFQRWRSSRWLEGPQFGHVQWIVLSVLPASLSLGSFLFSHVVLVEQIILELHPTLTAGVGMGASQWAHPSGYSDWPRGRYMTKKRWSDHSLRFLPQMLEAENLPFSAQFLTYEDLVTVYGHLS